MQPPRIEEVTLRMPRHHLSVQEVRRLAVSYVNHCMSIHPKYEAKKSFSVVVFSDLDDGLHVGTRIVEALPNYVVFDIHAMYESNLNDLDANAPLAPRAILENADIIVEMGTVHPQLAELNLNPNRQHIKVIYME